MPDSKKNISPKPPLLTPFELRVIAISLAVLSLGLAIAYLGLFLTKN